MPAIYGTLVTSAIAMLIGIPLAFGVALFITELCPLWLKRPLEFTCEIPENTGDGQLLEQYDLTRGYVWILIPAWTAIGPTVMRGLRVSQGEIKQEALA